MAENDARTTAPHYDEDYMGRVARPHDTLTELFKLVERSQKYDPTREATFYAFRNACFHCGKLMSYFWSQYQQIRRKEEEPK